MTARRRGRWAAGLVSAVALNAVAAAADAPAAAPSAMGRVEVVYVEPDRFVDIGFGSFERERNLKALEQQLQRLGRGLPEGQTLKLEITDVDLAGNVEPVRHDRLRILRGGADWPRIEMRYTLRGGGQVLKSGAERLTDMNYLWTQRLADRSSGELAFEGRLVRDWFDQNIAPLPR